MTFAGISAQRITGSPEISPQGLVLAYDMRTLTPRGHLKDFSGRGNDGLVVGTEPVPGPLGPARAFRSCDDYVALPFDRSIHIRGPISVAVWVRFTQLGLHQHVLAYDDLYSLWIDNKDRLRFSDTRGDALESHRGVVSEGEWTSVVATFSGRRGSPITDRNIALYVNGRPTGGRAFGIWNPGSPVEGYVGKESHEGQFHLPFQGEIAAVLVFRRSLLAHEARAFADVPSLGIQRALASMERVDARAAGGEAASLLTAPGGRPAGRAGDGALARLHDSALLSSQLTPLARPDGVDRGELVQSASVARRSGIIHVCPRIVRITNIVPPYRIPTLELLQDSPVIRFEQWVMALSERNRKWDPPRSSSRFRIFRDVGIDLSHRDMFTLHVNPGMLWELSRRPPDLVILGGYEQPTCLAAGLLLARMGIPFLLSSESISLRDSPVGRQLPFLVRKLVRLAEGIVVPGRASRDHLLELGASEDRIFVAPNAVDVERFVPAQTPTDKETVRRALGLPNKTLCLYVARLAATKGITDLLDAFSSLRPGERNLHLVVGGQGLLRPTIERRVSEDPALRGNVSVVGYVPEDLLPKYFAASDMFVFPTKRDIWGLVLNEAMCAGLPVIASDGAAGALDLIDDGVSGMIVPRRDPAQLAAAIQRLHEDPDLRRQMGLRARERILTGFTPKHQASGFLRAIDATLARLGGLESDVPGIRSPTNRAGRTRTRIGGSP